MNKIKSLAILLLSIFSVHSQAVEVVGQYPFPIEDIPVSIPVAQERRFFKEGVFLDCDSGPETVRRPRISIRSQLLGTEDRISYEGDLSEWVRLPGLDQELESMSSIRLSGLKFGADGTQASFEVDSGEADAGTLLLSRDSETGGRSAVFRRGGKPDLSFPDCRPTQVVCFSEVEQRLPYFFLNLAMNGTSNASSLLGEVGVSYDFDPFGSGEHITGSLQVLAYGQSSAESIEVRLPDREGSLSVSWNREKNRHEGYFSFLEPLSRIRYSKEPLICQMGTR